MGYTPGLQPEAKHIAIKMPVFSFEKIRGADISLGPEMKSTGECLGIAENFNEALYKAFIGAGIKLPKYKNMIITVKDEDQQEVVPIARRFEALGYRIYATRGTARVLKEKRNQKQSVQINWNSRHQTLWISSSDIRSMLLSIHRRRVWNIRKMVS